jgi:hypothetical protein
MLLQQAETEYKEEKTTAKLKRNKDLSTEVWENQKELWLCLTVNILAQRTKIVQKRETQSTIFCVCLFMRELLINIVLFGGDGNTSKKRRQQNSKEHRCHGPRPISDLCHFPNPLLFSFTDFFNVALASGNGIQEKTTAKLKNKWRLIPTVWDHYVTFTILLTPLFYHFYTTFNYGLLKSERVKVLSYLYVHCTVGLCKDTIRLWCVKSTPVFPKQIKRFTVTPPPFQRLLADFTAPFLHFVNFLRRPTIA